MPFELIYTSAERGLRSGSTGFSTVAQTEGIFDALTEQLESLSVYRHLKVGNDPAASGNPVVFAHTVIVVGRRTYHVVSRLADTGLDHTERSNFLAHHVAFAQDELPPQGPAWICQHWAFETEWNGSPRMLPAGQSVPRGKVESQKCVEWEAVTGDAGWGGVLAGATRAGEPAHLVCAPGQETLPLLAESINLLPPPDRWNVTFNTFYTKSAAAADCQWRCVLAGSAEARFAISAARGLVLRLDKGQPAAQIPEGKLVELARTGEAEQPLLRDEVPAAAPPKKRPAPRPAHRVPASFSDPLPPEEEETVETPRPRPRAAAPAPPPPAPGFATRTLLIGLFLGLLLALVAGALIEIGARTSFLRVAGIKDKHTEDIETELAEQKANRESELQARDKKWKEREAALGGQLAAAKEEASNQQLAIEEGKKRERGLEVANSQLREEKKKALLENASLHNELMKTAPGLWGRLQHHYVTDWLTKRPQGPSLPSVVIPFPIPLPIEKNGQFMRVSPNGGTLLEAYGLPMEYEIAKGMPSKELVIKRKGAKMKDPPEAKIVVTPEGGVTLVNENLDPRFGLIVLRLSSDKREPVYYQFIRPRVYSPNRMAAIQPASANATFTYVFDPKLNETKDQPLLKDVFSAAEVPAIFPGSLARVLYAARVYELHAMPDNVNSLVYSEPDGKLVLRLSVENGKVNLDVTDENLKAAAAPMCELLTLDVGRKIEGPKGQVIWQEVFRVR